MHTSSINCCLLNKWGINLIDLIGLAVILLIFVIAYVLGAQGIASFSMEIVKWLIIIFLIIVVILFLYGRI